MKSHLAAGDSHLEIEIGVNPAGSAHLLKLLQDFIEAEDLLGADLLGDLEMFAPRGLLLQLRAEVKKGAGGFRGGNFQSRSPAGDSDPNPLLRVRPSPWKPEGSCPGRTSADSDPPSIENFKALFGIARVVILLEQNVVLRKGVPRKPDGGKFPRRSGSPPPGPDPA